MKKLSTLLFIFLLMGGSACGGSPENSSDDLFQNTTLIKDERLTEEQRRAFFFRDPTDKQGTFYVNVEQIAYCEKKLPLFTLAFGASSVEQSGGDGQDEDEGSRRKNNDRNEPVPPEETMVLLADIFDHTAQGLTNYGREGVLNALRYLVNRTDRYGNTVLHKFAYFLDVDADLYAQLSDKQKQQITTEALAERLKLFINLGAPFEQKNHMGQTPVDIFRFPDSIGAGSFRVAFEEQKKLKKEQEEKLKAEKDINNLIQGSIK